MVFVNRLTIHGADWHALLIDIAVDEGNSTTDKYTLIQFTLVS